MEGNIDEQLAKASDDHYVWKIFYYDPNDSRVFVPKRCKWLGWTLNFGNKKSWGWIAGITAAIVGTAIYAKRNGKKMHYSFDELKEIFSNAFKKE
ncbi:hypothetical protein JH06_4576 [Blastocystis sp. subtype 4]|uniref:hypothetical protein n=1 Tax=Blastocystis sp. subtype 4 TaxID=944170 RepID=UPI000711ED9A|nr:hypothetical protein JH06_4576 [Blastocystis sp. subtype 4]KNB41908.1 hypothetical protein JH06_4576 [Blastocystis sp. subtype 4]|eukprot:XP_014525351.1 hypothetical protein JH06_4576 [Blastocystis sp. subtype 4]